MGEHYPGTIEIGGDLPRSKLKKFLEVLRDSGGGADWEGGFAGKTKESLAELYAAGDGKTLKLCNAQASFGSFGDIEAFCRKNNLPYDAHCDSHHENNAYHSRWRPGRDNSVEVASDNDHRMLVDAGPVAKARRHLSEGNVIAAIKTLDEVLVGVSIDPLPPFHVT
jgi:hypothetical protein